MSRTLPAPGDSSKRAGASRTSSSGSNAGPFLDRVRETIAAYRMIAAGDLVVVAISGGPDSTVLLHALVQLHRKLRFRLRAAHLHHGLRGEEADADARAAAALARKLDVPLSTHETDVPARAKAGGLSLEVAAREARYEWLEVVANRFQANRIATGHTANDQAETVLINLLRGTGPRGLAGIPYVRGRIVRPLITLTREEVEQYCREHDLNFRIDKSNRDASFTRNRIRSDVLPLLERIQPAVVRQLARLAEIVRAEDDFLSVHAENALRGVAVQRPGEVGILLSLFGALPPALARRVIRAAIARVKGDDLDIDFERVDAVVQLAVDGRTGAIVQLPVGLRAERTYGEIVIAPTPAEDLILTREWTLPVPGTVALQELGLEIAASRSRAKRPPPSPLAALVDAAKVEPPLLVRTRRRGDRFRPIGMKQSMKLQDFFVNTKVPRSDRDRVPLVLSGGEIIWVVGYRISESTKVTPKTKRTIRLDVTRRTE